MRVRTGYSFKVAVGSIDDVISRIKHIRWKFAPISDRMSTFGFNKWTKACAKAGLKPIYGVEIGVVAELGAKKPIIDYWTFYAKDSLRSIHDLIALATGPENPGREPTLLYKQALAAKGVIKIAGERIAVEHINKKDRDLYVALSPAMPKAQYNILKKAKVNFVACSENYFPKESDLEFYRVTLGKRSNTQSYPLHLMDAAEWDASVEWFADKADRTKALKNIDVIAEQCNAKMKKAKLLKPKITKTLKQLCEEGAKAKSINLNDKVYKERLERELKLIADKKFEDYFYIIADMVAWARQRMVVGPARGSSCGSLVCFLLDITTIDPIPYGLIFERFIDLNRSDLPDIDIDFSDQRRQMVFDYAEEKYGSDRVARLGTVGLFKPRSALNTAGAGLRVPKWQVEKVLDSVVERSSGDSRALQALEDTLNDTEAGRKLKEEYPEILIASRMEGHPQNASQHAAGIVVTDEPVTEYVAVDMRAKAAMCDKKDAEDLNLLKIDALGLTQLSIFERTLELIGKGEDYGFLDRLPTDDQKAFDELNKGHFAGVFQFNGMSLQSLTKQIKVTNIEDIISITALARPGPMATGGANSWVKRKIGSEAISTMHPMLTELTKDTLGITIYQEQVMNIVRHMGRMSWEDTSAIRKAMSGRLGNEFFERYWQKFRKGAIENGIDENTAKEIWDQINTFGSWAFNRSHAVAYGKVSYYCCWLKAYHPLEFAAATLDAETEPAKQIALLREMRNEGIDYIPVDPEHSIDKWTVVKKGKQQTLVGPLTMIKGIGPAALAEILDARRSGEPLRATLRKRLEGAKTEIDTLFPVADTIQKLHPDGLRYSMQPIPIKDVQCGIRGPVIVFAVASKIAPKDENEAVNIQKRGGRVLSGPTKALNLFVMDDTDKIFAKVDRFKFERLGKDILEKGRVGRSLYAIKGTVPPSFRMISITNIEYLGELDADFSVDLGGQGGSKRQAGD